MIDLNDRVALISGGARGQGEAAARLFVSLGAKVVIGDVLEEEGRQVADDIGEACRFQRLDVTAADDWKNAVDSAVRHFGHLDVLVNNAGIMRVGTIDAMPESEFMTVIRVNLLGCYLGMQAAAPAMRKAGRGSIVNISSTAGIEGVPGVGAYVASKFGVRGLTKTAALEFGHDGIRVNSVHPGTIDTPMINGPEFAGVDREAMMAELPIPRSGQPIDVARMVAFLASDASAYSTGAEFLVDGGAMTGAAFKSR